MSTSTGTGGAFERDGGAGSGEGSSDSEFEKPKEGCCCEEECWGWWFAEFLKRRMVDVRVRSGGGKLRRSEPRTDRVVFIVFKQFVVVVQIG